MSNEVRASVHILLADDDMDDRAFFTRVLRSFPHAVLSTVDDGVHLLKFLAEDQQVIPDIIFLDLNMPRMNGFECLAMLQSDGKLAKIPVIIYSTFIDAKGADKLFNGGAYYFVRKEGMDGLKSALEFLLGLLIQNKLEKPDRDAFVLAI